MQSKVVKNASWIIGIRIIQSLLAFVIGSITARYLGPSNYGVIGYAQSIVTFVVPIMQLGLTAILVQELVQNPDDEGKILGTAHLMSMISAIVCMIGVVSFAVLFNAGETETIIVCALYSLVLLCQSFELIQYWFQAKYLAKYSSTMMLVAYVLVSGYKIFLLVSQKSVYWFAVSYALDYLLIAFGLHFIYRKMGGQGLRFSSHYARALLSKGKYYIVSGLMVTVFAQTDRIMLKQMIDETATGFYTAATTCAGLASFFFTAVIDSMRPMVVESKAVSQEKYEKSVVQLYSVIIYSALFYSLCIFLVAPFIVRIVYGDSYLPTVPILRVIVWYSAFSVYGGAKNIWMLVEEKQKYLLVLNMGGAAINVMLNFALIPYSGAVGAAAASLVTQICTNVIFGFLIKELRPNNRLLLKALNPIEIFSIGKKLFCGVKH